LCAHCQMAADSIYYPPRHHRRCSPLPARLAHRLCPPSYSSHRICLLCWLRPRRLGLSTRVRGGLRCAPRLHFPSADWLLLAYCLIIRISAVLRTGIHACSTSGPCRGRRLSFSAAAPSRLFRHRLSSAYAAPPPQNADTARTCAVETHRLFPSCRSSLSPPSLSPPPLSYLTPLPTVTQRSSLCPVDGAGLSAHCLRAGPAAEPAQLRGHRQPSYQFSYLSPISLPRLRVGSLVVVVPSSRVEVAFGRVSPMAVCAYVRIRVNGS